MVASATHWKTAGIDDLRGRARNVMDASSDIRMSARVAAQCMVGIVSLISRRWSVDVMQRACADLARNDDAWSSSLGKLPLVNGAVSEQMELLAVVCRGVLPLAGAQACRAALAFWAVESDPAVWSSVAA